MPDDEHRQIASARLGRVLRGKYRLDRVLGVGGMAAVYAATHRNKKRFAIKVLHPELSASESIRARFLREGYVANSVEHSGAVAVLDDDVAEDGSAFLVMELLEGTALDEVAHRFDGGKVPLGLALSIGDALLDVLRAAHAKGVVHRDLKPANLFLTDDGRLEVLDFGIARLHDLSGPEHATRSGAVLGTPAFMAPEQALADSGKIDAQTDLWAVGATLFTLLAGELVHEAPNAAQLMVRAATTKARSITVAAPEVPREIAAAIDRALAFEKTERWASAREMQEALGRACLSATGAAVAPLPKSEAAIGLETTMSDGAARGGDGRDVALDPTVAAEGDALANDRAGRTTAGAEVPSVRQRDKWRWRSAVLGVAALGVIGSVGVALARRHRAEAEHATTAGTVPPSAPRPGRAAATPEAAAAYEAALQADHDGNEQAAQRSLQAALASDPALGAAHLRRAIFLIGRASGNKPVDAHEEFRKAIEHRTTLGEVDAALLDAWEPAFREPPDRLAREARMKALAEKYPQDAYVQTLYAFSTWAVGHAYEGAYERAFAADPTYVPPYALWFNHAFYAGDDRTRRAVTERCLRASPTAVECLDSLAMMDSNTGDCALEESDARRILAVDPARFSGYEMLAAAMAGAGEPTDAVSAVLQRGLATVTDEKERKGDELFARRWLALLRGDFETARAAALEHVELVSSSTRDNPALFMLRQVPLLIEMGDLPQARALVERATTANRAWSTTNKNPRVEAAIALNREHTGLETPAERKAALEEIWRDVEARMRAEGGVIAPFDLWRSLYGYDLETAEDAEAALADLDRYGIAIGGLGAMGIVVGRAAALAGRCAEALSFLEKEGAQCGEDAYVHQTDHVLRHVKDLYLLGLCRERTGDLRGAKSAYDRVLAHWGRAKRSVTAEAARAAAARIGKGP